MQAREAMRVLCGLVAAGGLGAECFYLSLSASERAAIDGRVVQLSRDLFDKSVETLNYIEARLVHKVARAQPD